MFAGTLLLLAALTHDHTFMAGSDASRLATIEALVDHGQTHIDDSRYRWTVDRVTIAGHEYSNKPPLFSLLGAAVYLPGRALLGLDFEQAEARTIYLLTLVLVGCATAWLAMSFHDALGLYGRIRPPAKWLTTLALVTGTILTSFSTTFNNHPLAAAWLFAACRAAAAGSGLAAGAWVGLTGCIDILPGLVFAPFLAVIVGRQGGRAALLRYAAAASLGAILFVGANGLIVGSPFPPKMVPGAVDHTADFGPQRDAVKINVPVRWFPDDWSMPLRALLGWRGFLSISPVLLFGVAGLLVNLIRGGGPLPRQQTAMLGAAGLVVAAGHLLLIGSFGGWSYGYRYLIPLVPVLLLFAPRVLSGWWLRGFAAALCVSVPLAWLGAYHPWPPLHEPEMKGRENPAVAGVRSPVGANLSGWLEQRFPESACSRRAAATFIGRDERDHSRYRYLFYRSRNDRRAAIDELRRYVRTRPDDDEARYELVSALGMAGEIVEATTVLRALVASRPGFLQARVGLGGLLAAGGKLDSALEEFATALAARPDWPPAMNGLARLAATHPSAASRDGPFALRTALRAVAMTRRRNAVMLDTLAAAQAAAGRYEQAADTAAEAMRVAWSVRQEDLARSIGERLELYRQRRPVLEERWDPAVGAAVALSGRWNGPR